MKKIILVLIVGLMLIGTNVFAEDVSIDSDGNVTTGTSNSNGNLEVTGASGEDGIVGSTSGTGAAGVYGVNTTSNNYGILGYDNYGVYGNSSGGYAGYFQGNARVTGNLTVDGQITETDPVFSAWDKSTGISITESQITDLNHFTTGDETDPQVGTLTNTKWCTSDGTQVNCTSDTPPGSGDGHSLDADDGSPTNVVYVNSTGKVGIGTTSPSEKLEISGGNIKTSGVIKVDGSGDSYIDGSLGVGTTSPSEPLHIKADSGHDNIRLDEYSDIGGNYWKIGIDSGGDLNFEDNGSQKITFQEGGNVGIGTNSPDYILEVNGDVGFSEKLNHAGDPDTYLSFTVDDIEMYAGGKRLLRLYESLQDSVTLGDGSDVDINLNDYLFVRGSDGNVGIGDSSPDAHLEVSANGSTGGDIFLLSSNDTYDGDLFTVKEDGNVGIGTKTPDYKLEVNGSIGFSDNVYHAGDINTYFSFLSDTIELYAGGKRLLRLYEYGSSDSVTLGDGTDVDINLNDNLFVRGSDGNVGIGTTNPGEKLEVNGDIQASGYKSSDGSSGLTQTVSLKGSDGNNCTLTIKNGLITGTTCP